MRLACLDLEGVLIPEIWQSLAAATEIDELYLTTRDVPDYDRLMRRRLEILAREGITLQDIQRIAAEITPLVGAKEFLDDLRSQIQVVILSDTYEEFAGPVMRRLGRPTILCNSLTVSPDGRITDYKLRQADGKVRAVQAFKSLNVEVFAAGDSYNDLGMIREADSGAFFRPPSSITGENPAVPAFSEYGDLYRYLTA
jgi:phosphoserine/homoserine phosphotransferase